LFGEAATIRRGIGRTKGVVEMYVHWKIFLSLQQRGEIPLTEKKRARKLFVPIYGDKFQLREHRSRRREETANGRRTIVE